MELPHDQTNYKRHTLLKDDSLKFPLPPKPVSETPFKDDITEDKRGSTRLLIASSGFAWMHAQQSRPTSAIAPGRIFIFRNLETFFIACSVNVELYDL